MKASVARPGGVCTVLPMSERTERTERLALRVAPEENKMVQEIAVDDGSNASAVVRRLVRREHAARFGPKRATRRR